MNFKKFLIFILLFVVIVSGAIKVNAIEFEYGCYYDTTMDNFKTPEERYWNPSNEATMRSDSACAWNEDELGRVFSYDSTNKSIFLQKDLGIELEYTENGVYKYEGAKSKELEESIVNIFQHTKYDSIPFQGASGTFSGLRIYKFTNVMFDYSNLNDYYNKFEDMPDVIVECQYVKREVTNAGVIDIDSAEDIYTIKYVYYTDDMHAVLYDEGFGTRTSCRYFATDIEKSLNACYSFDAYLVELQNYATTYSCESNEFKEKKQELIDICEVYRNEHGTAIEGEDGTTVARACSERCSWLEDEVAKICDTYSGTYRCGAIGVKLAAWLIKILKIIRYIIPVLVIILSVLDYIGAVASADDDAMKKATKKFTKRIIASVVIFLLPVILQFLFDIFKIAGLESGNPFCMK